MKVIFMGTPDFAVPVLQGLIDNYEVVLVVTQPDKKVGRHHLLQPPPIKALAMKYNIPVFQPAKIRSDYQEVLDYKPDMIVTCAYGQIVPKEVLDCPKFGCINVHASLLPKLRGGAPIHKAIIEGHASTGITIMYMDVGMDDGDIISQSEVEILDSDNLESLHDKLSVLGAELLLDTIPSILNGTNKRLKQDINEVTFAYNIKREEEHIDFSKSSREIYNLIRGLFPTPMANAILFEREIKICESRLFDKIYSSNVYGEIVEVLKEGIVVVTGDGALLITKVKPFGKKVMDASSYVNGIGKEKIIGKVFL